MSFKGNLVENRRFEIHFKLPLGFSYMSSHSHENQRHSKQPELGCTFTKTVLKNTGKATFKTFSDTMNPEKTPFQSEELFSPC